MPLKKQIKSLLLKTIWAFDSERLVNSIHKLGVHPGDTIMVHASWRPDSGFKGSVQDIIQAFLDAVGPDGTVCMMSMPFQGMSASEYLQTNPVFDVNRTVSMVGVISEVFRRKKGVVRSLHPTHSITAMGKNAGFLVKGHERCLSPFGRNSPFDKLAQLKGKILLYDVPFNTMTYEHYLEDVAAEKTGLPIYEHNIHECSVRTASREIIKVQTKVLSKSFNEKRDTRKLEEMLSVSRCIKKFKIGRVYLSVIDAEKSKAVVEKTV